MAKSNRRTFLAKAPAVALAAGAATAAAPSPAAAASKPAKKVHWSGGKAPD